MTPNKNPQHEKHAEALNIWWAYKDLNLGQRDYEAVRPPRRAILINNLRRLPASKTVLNHPVCATIDLNVAQNWHNLNNYLANNIHLKKIIWENKSRDRPNNQEKNN